MGRLGVIACAMVLALLVGVGRADALENGLARTPPMGWNAFYSLGCRVDERVVRATADTLITSGMAALGYRYVLLDDCWMARGRDGSGALRADPGRFPSGIPALADYVHSRGLSLGLYIAAGSRTCQRYAGSAGHFEQDVQTIAGWGADYLKVDWCDAGASPQRLYARVSRSARTTGRPMVFSVSNWGWNTPWTWAPGVANLWRVAGDIDWRRPWPVVLSTLDIDAGLAGFAGPGAWNDPDILPVGSPGLNEREMRSAFSLWSVLAAPLIAGNDLLSMSSGVRQILTNTDVIAVDQDPAGRQGQRIAASRGREVWIRSLAGGDRAVLFFNRRGPERPIGLTVRRTGLSPTRRYLARELWTGRRWIVRRFVSVRVPRHGVALFRLTRHL